MKYRKYSNTEICEVAPLSNPTVVEHIKKWNKLAIKAIKDHQGGSNTKLDPEIIDNLIDVTINLSSDKFGFSAFSWSCALLAI